ncbi:hypothetical protein [Aneurinibacillus aneurinilyticus]|jgi:hypothetical protein|uniref:Uncharacterized protein n=1 Tax=Aneurinibacillus aneurinilyticus TaxID=1391 RepID=A0A848CS91_ANEAE|nr:hypothetical protein [Aneurinibacillus aneurinilyticus]NME98495.1 hypothetical protein [Aneurinibacillus aneurinilyticus]
MVKLFWGMLADAYGVLRMCTFFGGLTLLGLVPQALVTWFMKRKFAVLQ